jgi:hypothetical protein
MRRSLLAALAALAFAAPAAAYDCWVAGGFQGKSAPSDEGFNFIDDKFADGMMICLRDDGGTVTGNDLSLLRLGESTLIGWASNGLGLEVVNTYQIDRDRGKLLLTQSRIGTASEVPILPDYAAVFVADIVPVP